MCPAVYRRVRCKTDLLLQGGFFMASKRKFFTTADVAFSGILIALGIVLNMFVSIPLGAYKLTLSYTITYIAGHFMGPIFGALVGGLGDAISCFYHGYAPDPVLLVGNIFIGLISGGIQLLSRLSPTKKRAWHGYLWTILTFVAFYCTVTVFWNTWGTWRLYANGRSFFVYLAARLPAQTVTWAINLAISLVLYPILTKALHFRPKSLLQWLIYQHKDKSATPELLPDDTTDATPTQGQSTADAIKQTIADGDMPPQTDDTSVPDNPSDLDNH